MFSLEQRKKEYEDSFNKADKKKVDKLDLKEELEKIELDFARDIIDSAKPELTGLTKTGFVMAVNVGRGENNGARFKVRIKSNNDTGKKALALYKERFPVVEKILSSKKGQEAEELKKSFSEVKELQKQAEAA